MTRRSILAAMCALLAPRVLRAQDAPPAHKPAESQPDASGLRTPRQAEQLAPLLRQREARPVTPVSERPGKSIVADDSGVLADGTSVADRPGRLVRVGDHCEFEFVPSDGAGGPISLEVLRNQYLELMEAEAERGVSEFVISAEITRYRGTNYLLLRKLLRRVANGNLSP